MSLYLTNIPNPVQVIRLDCLSDSAGQKWMGCVVDAMIGYPSAYICFRGDLRYSSFSGADTRINSRRDVWFKVPIREYAKTVSILRKIAVNPHKYKGIILLDIPFGPYKGRLTSPPKWSKTLISAVKF